MLEARQVAFRYDKSVPWILNGVDFVLKPNEVVGLPGPSGRGKTTLAKILAGYLSPSDGRVLLDGAPLDKNEERSFWRRRVPEKSKSITNGFCPVQLLFQHPELTVNPRWKIRDIVSEAAFPSSDLLDALSIDSKWMGRYPHELSGGEIQRVCLARVLASEQVRYLICDEMTSMLDALTQVSIWHALLTVAKKREIGILVISHDPALISRICRRELQL